MKHPGCGGFSQVLDSREVEQSIRRRRKCRRCGGRWTTYEHPAKPEDLFRLKREIETQLERLLLAVRSGAADEDGRSRGADSISPPRASKG